MEATTTQAVELPLAPEHGTPPPESCRLVLDILNRIGDKWTVMVIGTLSNGPMRFNAILRAISGISHRMLTLTLRGLEQDGLVKRTAYATIPPKVEYELTELGLSLIEPLRALGDWAVRNRPAIAAARAHFASLTAAQ
ncbi:winged helix-turn-helix transcriptional regulator [Ralstonia pseudosolanacearum]|uniref:Helix-turn-helix transcriptional regulator n=1 Tax=Ralstonia solanacearum TaxID=305 RepID=A0AA92K4T5_RALSL|nr:helix-turn-helix domain-containing protein [Ralstonia pseudosolanacearum]CBJ40469.1 putative transcription regulator protein [Ralstonia solanacearum CMR15]QOK93644.1 helix-turn-helix transcriptional regulator [Ralstonia pseudosolanacearum]QOK98516.1 helix-turn-helix transcriptional regulator [Ralstonia pseudosolanacearum]UWD88533.1 helix-turn-helix transcriptional regulator [Ralstonia pseudosolanacearum]CAH0443255.1 putative HTH-type transcriptional regulator YybR [Ralstonia pseudosolanacea